MKNDFPIWFPNGCGLFVALFCNWVYTSYGTKIAWQLYGICLAVILYTIHLTIYEDTATVGLIGCALSVALSASPLATVRSVIEERSTASMPFETSLLMFLSAISWVLYGTIVVYDPVIFGPNILSLFLSAFQLSLFVVYPNKSR